MYKKIIIIVFLIFTFTQFLSASGKSEPTGEIPTGEIPTGEIPTGEIPTGEIPTGEIPTGEIPSGEIPSSEIPSSEIPSSEIPSSEIPSSEIPSSEIETLYQKTLYQDISTASYYELESWCIEVGIKETGNNERLQTLLYQHYNINSSNQIVDNSISPTIVKIVRADNVDYYNVEEKEDYVRITGRVKLVVKQTDKHTTHTIEADSILFNQTINIMTASGNIVYEKDHNGNIEEYTGDNLTFNVKNWKGVILKGVFKKNQDVNGNSVDFIFSGESINKGEGDVVVLNDGTISSCDFEEKHYKIKAKKIWILGPDEWAILSGIMYIGNIPVMYIPFYHLPGNDIFFNPAIGKDNINGFYIQTTTYLLGVKPKGEEDDSFFINVADSEGNYKPVRKGLYLFKEEAEEKEDSTDYIKFMLDYYSKLGAFTGIEGSIEDLWLFDGLKFYLGLGVSKSIGLPDGDSVYTNYFEENNYEAEWNSTILFGATLPFRYGMDIQFTFADYLTLKFEMYSDPSFNSDFKSDPSYNNVESNREENFDWMNYLLSLTDENDTSSNTSGTSVSTLDWSLTASSIPIPVTWANPFISNLSFSPVSMKLLWNNKENTNSTSSEYDPCRNFYYPESFTWPHAKLNISGTIFKINTSQENDSFDPPENIGDFISPWETITQNEDDNYGDNLKEPEAFENKIIDLSNDVFSTELSYTGYNTLTVTSTTDSSGWVEPADTNLDNLDTTLSNNNSLTINYDFIFFDNLFSFDGTNKISTGYKEFFGDYTAEEEVNNTKSANSSTYVLWTNGFTFTITPLKNVKYFSQSDIKYYLNTNLFNYKYNSTTSLFDQKWASWDSDYITKHSTSATFRFNISFLDFGSISSGLSFSSTLPPTDIIQSIDPSLTIEFFNWSNTLKFGIDYEENKWTLEPLTIDSKFTPFDNIKISESLEYDFDLNTLTSSVSTLKLWDFDASFTMAHTEDYDWDSGGGVDVIGLKAFVPKNFNMSYNIDYKTPKLWKNRLEMDFSVTTSLYMDLQQYYNSKLTFDFKYHLNIFQFLDFTISLKSVNDHVYMYFKSIRDYYGISEERSFFGDLLKSFNIFSPNQQDRKDSFFNMSMITVNLVHHLHDWDLKLEYTGKPGSDVEWDSTFSISVTWNPIEKIQIFMDKDEDDSWTVVSEENE